MNIPEEFKNTIASVFYDKKADIYNAEEIVGEELDVERVKGKLKEPLECNVQFIGNEVAKKDYGLDIEASIMITCKSSVGEIGDFLVYDNKDYYITGKLPLDSHIKLFARLI